MKENIWRFRPSTFSRVYSVEIVHYTIHRFFTCQSLHFAKSAVCELRLEHMLIVGCHDYLTLVILLGEFTKQVSSNRDVTLHYMRHTLKSEPIPT